MEQNELGTLTRKLNELVWSEVYHDTIRGSGWLSPEQAFSPGRGAIGYPMMYVMYRILNEVKPTSILELGMGQSTKLIGSYAAVKKEETRHYIVEHDENWIRFFSNHFTIPDTTEIIKMDIEDVLVTVNEGSADKQHYTNVTKYVDFGKKLQGKHFDLIMIDGPYGYRSPEFSRIDILDLIPDCLEESFVILMDDCDRTGERQTCEMIKLVLQSEHIPFNYGIYSGEKDIIILTSENLNFLCLM